MAVRVVQGISIDGQVWLLIFPEFPIGWVAWVHLMLGSVTRQLIKRSRFIDCGMCPLY